MLRAALLPFIAAGLALLAGPAAAQTQTLRVSAIPDENPTELLRKFTPLGAYLEKETGMKVAWTPVNDYPAVVEGLAGGRIDLAWLGGLPSCRCAMRTGNAIPIVQRAEDEKFISRFIVPVDSRRSAADLKGKTFAFGSPSSTSGHLMPRYFLLKEGIDPDKDFSRIAFSGAHDATVAFVASGRADAGVLNASVWDRLVEKGDANAKVGCSHHAAVLRLQLDRARRPRPGAGEEAHRRLPQARSGEPGAQGDPRPAARLEVHPDEARELQGHRGRGARRGAARLGRTAPARHGRGSLE